MKLESTQQSPNCAKDCI